MSDIARVETYADLTPDQQTALRTKAYDSDPCKSNFCLLDPTFKPWFDANFDGSDETLVTVLEQVWCIDHETQFLEFAHVYFDKRLWA